jgi:hypothetical protein
MQQQFESVVDAGSIALSWLDYRKELGKIVAKGFGGKQPLAGRHPVDIAPQGVDFAVVL